MSDATPSPAAALDEAARSFRDEPARAFDHLLAAWRGCRTEELAALVTRASRLLARGRASVTGANHREIQAAWLAVEAADDPLDVDRLLASLVVGRCEEACVRVDRLAARPDDPRIRDALVGALCAGGDNRITSIAMRSATIEAMPFTSKPKRAFWTRHLLPLLERLGDATILVDVNAAQRRRYPAYPEIVEVLAHWIERTRPVFEARTAVAPPGVRAAAAGVAAVLDAGAAELASEARTLELLFADVWARPDADEPRMVLADLLSDRGDPRGEFIALQLARHHGTITREGKAREKELLKRHKRDWLGPIAPLIQPYHLRFERGFLVTCQLEPNEELERDLGEHPAWSTIREFVLHDYSFAAGAGTRLAAHLERLGATRSRGGFTRGIA